MARTERTLFCNLCQAVIPKVANDLWTTNGEAHINKLPWYKETRAVRADRDTSSPFLTGVGFLDNDDVLEASHDPDVSYRLPTGHRNGALRINYINVAESGAGQPNRPKYLTFIFHDACWQLFLAGVLAGLPETVTACRTSQDQARLVAEGLFRYLSCMPFTKLNQVVIKHELPPYRQAGVSLPNGYAPTDRAIMMADPSDLSTLPLDGLPQVAGHDHDSHHYTINPNFHLASSTDALFSTLPEELIHQILNLLPCPDFCNLRLASRSVASVSNPSQLPRSFWVSRFEPENGMGFYFAGRPFPDSKLPIDYRTLHSALRLELSKVTGTMNLRNRRRIWRMLREMSRCITLAIGQIWSSTNGDSDTGTSSVHIPEGHVAGRLVCPSPLRGGPVTKALQRSVGTTIFARQAAAFPHHLVQAPLCVGVSFLSVDCRPYVCGIRFLAAGLDDSCRVGVVFQETETIIALQPGDELAGFRVACLANGVIGLGLLVRPVTNPDCAPMLHPITVGNLDTSTGGLGLADLTSRSRGLPTGIMAGLDACCRIISLQLLESQSSVCKEKEQISTGPFAPQATQPRLQTVLWSPSIPRNVDDIITPRTKPGIHGSVSVREEEGSDFVLNIPFGGENGERLKTLNRIVAYTDPLSEYGSFKGFSFVYDDEPAEVFYGIKREFASFPIAFRQCLQSSFAINGKNGEVIDHMEVFGLVSHRYKLDAIKLTTNHGRSVHFKPESEGLLNKISRPAVIPDLRILRPPAGSTIIGLYANTHQPSGSVQALELQCATDIPVAGQATAWDASLSHRLLSPPPVYKLQDPQNAFIGNLGFGHSSGVRWLHHIRRIRVSYGSNSASRQPHIISGICFEFDDSDEPVYLGQWLNEIAAFDLAEEDGRVTGIATWRLHDRDRSSMGAMRDPWVDPFSHRLRTDQMYTGLQIETSSGKVFEIPPGDLENLGYERIQFRENAFEEFAGMSWKYSLHNDYFSPLYKQKHLYLSNLRFPYYTEKFFWQEAQDWHTGTCHDLSAIHAVWSSSAYLAGLVFEYGGGKIRRQVGSTDFPGATTKSLHLVEGEKITKMEILRPARSELVSVISFKRMIRKNVDYFRFYFIEFHTSLGQRALFHYRIPAPEEGDDQRGETHLEVCFTAYLFTSDGRYDPNRAVYPPESEVMGDQPEQGEQDVSVYAHCQFVGLGVTATEARPPPLFGSGICQAAIDGIQTLKAGYSGYYTRSQ